MRRAQAAPSRGGERRRKSDLTRERILEAASALIAERGGLGFQMSEVADRCGMSNGALYYYFPDKEAMAEEVFSRGVDRVLDALERSISNARSAHEALHNLCTELDDEVCEGRPAVVAMASELVAGRSDMLSEMGTRFGRIAHLVEVQLERAKAEGAVREGVDSSLAASCICGMLFSTAVTRMEREDAGERLGPCSGEVMDLVAHGVGVPGV